MAAIKSPKDPLTARIYLVARIATKPSFPTLCLPLYRQLEIFSVHMSCHRWTCHYSEANRRLMKTLYWRERHECDEGAMSIIDFLGLSGPKNPRRSLSNKRCWFESVFPYATCSKMWHTCRWKNKWNEFSSVYASMKCKSDATKCFPDLGQPFEPVPRTGQSRSKRFRKRWETFQNLFAKIMLA